MTQYELIYFDFDGGRGEPLRIAFHMAGINFKDKRITFPEFAEIRSNLMFNCVPVLKIDGAQITQSNAIGRYIAKLSKLYPTDDLQALYCDEVADAIEDVNHFIVQTFGLEGNELKLARKNLVDGRLSVYLKGLNKLLIRGGGEYFADGQLTIADLKVFVQTKSLSSGNLEHIPTDMVQNLAPKLVEHMQRVSTDPRVVAYYASLS